MEVVLADGTRATALTFDGRCLTLSCARAFAPGQPMRFNVDADHGTLALEGRAIGSKRDGESFRVRLRLVNLKREARDALRALV